MNKFTVAKCFSHLTDTRAVVSAERSSMTTLHNSADAQNTLRSFLLLKCIYLFVYVFIILFFVLFTKLGSYAACLKKREENSCVC